jgi:hypothetical protein
VTVTASKLPDGKLEVRFTYGPVTSSITEGYGHLRSFWGQLGRLLSEHPELREQHARETYERYRASSGGVSAITGDQLPAWEDQDDEVRGHWRKAAWPE